jgi:cell division septation protein DedD
MRDTHRLKEKYELSLDNRQIVTLSVASLVVLGGVFMLGVVVGKKLSTEPDRPPADLLSALDQQTAAFDSLKHDASLTFPEELTKKAPAVEARPEVVKAEPVKPEPKPAAAAEAPPAAPAAELPPAALAETPKSEPKLPESPKAEAVATTRTRDGGSLKDAFARIQRPPTEATADGAFTLQLSAYQDRTEAERFAAGLRDKGYAPFIVEANLPNKGLWYRVRMGRFPTREAATRYLEDLRRETQLNAIVTGN